jgi:glycine betaine/proline transport system ATP-binding protein
VAEIRFENVYKVFGPNQDEAIRLAEQGVARDEITERTGSVVAVRGVTLDIEPGELFVVMGLSGSGKSTLVRLINRLHPPTAGVVRVEGEDITRLSAKRLRQLRARTISMVFQRFALFPHRTVLQNAAFGLRVQGVPEAERESRAREALEMVGLEGWEANYPAELSGGMQQRVGLARALATDADVLLMDEPFSALDPLIRREIQVQLLEIQERLHKTIVFITHDLNEAMLLGDRIAVMKDGAVVQIGTPEELLTKPADDYVAAFTEDVDRTRVLTAGSVMREPVAVLSPRDGPKTAANLMQELDRTELYVLGRDRKVLGYVRDGDLGKLRGAEDRTLERILRADYPRVGPDAPLAELFGLAAQHVLPIAVVDEDERLLGVVPRPLLLAALGPAEEEAS